MQAKKALLEKVRINLRSSDKVEMLLSFIPCKLLSPEKESFHPAFLKLKWKSPLLYILLCYAFPILLVKHKFSNFKLFLICYCIKMVLTFLLCFNKLLHTIFTILRIFFVLIVYPDTAVTNSFSVSTFSELD